MRIAIAAVSGLFALLTASSSFADTVADATVALCRGRTKTECSFQCSGVLIAPNLVLTARHCVREAEKLEADCAGVVSKLDYFAPEEFWVTDALVMNPKVQFVQGKSWTASTWRSVCGDDVGVLEVDGILGTTSRSLPVPHFDGDSSQNSFLIATFGPLKAGDTQTVGTRKDLSTKALCFGGVSECTSILGNSGLKAGEILVDRALCGGDSGSPLLAGNDLFGTISRAQYSTTGCGYGISAGFSSHALTIARAARAAAEHGKYDPPAWVLQAEKRGNSKSFGLGEVGMPCDSHDECKSKDCRSRDGGRTFSCTKSCTEGSCGTGLTCATTSEGKFCYVPTKDELEQPSSCSVGFDHDPKPWLVLGGLGLACFWMRRKRQSRVA